MVERKATSKSIIDGELLVVLRERSSVYQCHYKIDGKWQRTSTKQRDIKKAQEVAKDIYKEAHWKKKNQVAPITRYFRDVAKTVVKRLQDALDSKEGKAVYRDYITAINRYLVPALGKYYVDSIDYKAFAHFEEVRKKKMKGKDATKSTQLTHNAALNKVFDEAIYRGYMVESNRLVLKAKGKASERRVEFSVEEVKAMRSNFDAWIEKPTDFLKPVTQENYKRVDVKELPQLLRDIDQYGVTQKGDEITRLGMRLMAYVFVRTSELIGARWSEINIADREWRIPPERMKMKDPHIVLMSDQVVTIFTRLKEITGGREFVLPSSKRPKKTMSNNTLLSALKRMGYANRMTGHGFRGVASTILHEQGYPHEHIEIQLAHSERNKVSASYNHAKYLVNRHQYPKHLPTSLGTAVQILPEKAHCCNYGV